MIILVVDDERPILRASARSLESAGYEVMIAAHPHAALMMFELGPRPDLVISDIDMPEMNGIEFARNLRTLQPTLPVIFATGWATDLLIDQANELGSILWKPFGKDALLRAVERALTGT